MTAMRSAKKLTVMLALTVATAVTARAQDSLPADVHHETRNRLPPAAIETEGTAASIRAQGTGRIVRWEFAHGRALSELAILAVARELDQPYEWSLHEIEALAVGLEPRIVDVVRNRSELTNLGEKETVIIQLGRELVGEHALSAETFARAERVLGRANLVDVVSLIGDYVATGLRLTAFNQQMPPGFMQFLPLPFTAPEDIHPDSRSRLPYLPPPGSNTAAAPMLYSRQLAPEGTGPGQMRRHGAGLATLEDRVGRRLLRLVALIAARGLDDQYQWTMNELAAPGAGLEADIVDRVRHSLPVADLAEKDAALIELGRELFGNNTISAVTYARALDVFGETDLVDLIDFIAQHARDAMLLIAFQQQLPAGQDALLPIP
jgi:4-carboxymuconolactone decarboxylase